MQHVRACVILVLWPWTELKPSEVEAESKSLACQGIIILKVRNKEQGE